MTLSLLHDPYAKNTMNEDRYSRQRYLTKDFDQAALQRATVLIVGMGGLGNHVATSLVTAGVGTLVLCDHDRISISNLNRQPLYCEADLGDKKVDVASQKLREINHLPQIFTCDTSFTNEHFVAPKPPHLILDCLDNLSSRKELIAYAVTHNIPLIHGAVEGFCGQMSVFLPGKTACPLCSLTEIAEEKQPPSSLSSCVSLVAALQATEAIKLLTHSGALCTNTILFFDALSNSFESTTIELDDNCLACSTGDTK